MNSINDLLLNDAPDEAVKAMKRIKKKLTEKRQGTLDDYKAYIPKDWGEIMTNLRKERFDHRFDIKNSADEMRLSFAVPANIYHSNPEYWSAVCKDKKLRKQYPEFIVGD